MFPSHAYFSYLYIIMYVKYIEQCLAHESCYKLNIKKHEDHGIWSYHFMADKGGKGEAVTDYIF